MYINYGTMLDFFDYSGVRVQDAKRYTDLKGPSSFGYRLLRDDERKQEYEKMIGIIGNEDAMRIASKKCNMFAIAKLGSPNMIFPQTLDVQVRNF